MNPLRSCCTNCNSLKAISWSAKCCFAYLFYSATFFLHPVLHLEVQSPGSFDISSLSSVQQASSVRSLTVPVVSSSCLFFLPASGLKKKLRYLHPVGVAIHIVQWQFYLQPLRVILHPLSIQQSQGQKDLTQVGAKDRQKARVFRAYPFLSGTKELTIYRLRRYLAKRFT
uniref:Uncharacterized protein n=1 Tax=Vicia faba TaxID=3906 RepID=R4ITV2_VICFA|nr:hypothetical protein [Vicia faba]